MIGFLNIKKIIIPFNLLEEAYEYLRKVGENHYEGIILFAGREDDETFIIKNLIVPKQLSYKLHQGLMNSVNSDELHRINRWLFNTNLTIMVQMHSHPKEAYHSNTDNMYPIVATVGGISIVIPNFANNPINIQFWAVFRLSLENKWRELSSQEIEDLFEIKD